MSTLWRKHISFVIIILQIANDSIYKQIQMGDDVITLQLPWRRPYRVEQNQQTKKVLKSVHNPILFITIDNDYIWFKLNTRADVLYEMYTFDPYIVDPLSLTHTLYLLHLNIPPSRKQYKNLLPILYKYTTESRRLLTRDTFQIYCI